MKNFISVTPSFLIKFAQEARGKSAKECLELCEKITSLSDSILDSNSLIKIAEKEEKEEIEVPDDLPEDLQELSSSLIGALETEV